MAIVVPSRNKLSKVVCHTVGSNYWLNCVGNKFVSQRCLKCYWKGGAETRNTRRTEKGKHERPSRFSAFALYFLFLIVSEFARPPFSNINRYQLARVSVFLGSSHLWLLSNKLSLASSFLYIFPKFGKHTIWGKAHKAFDFLLEQHTLELLCS